MPRRKIGEQGADDGKARPSSRRPVATSSRTVREDQEHEDESEHEGDAEVDPELTSRRLAGHSNP